jgi:amino acid transporter
MIVALFTAGLIYLVIDGPSTLVGNFSSDSTDGVAENSANVTNSNMTSDNGSNDNTDNNESSSVRASSWAGFGRAVVPCLWAFDGWADVGSLAEDIVNPGRNLPRIIVGSVAGVAALYLSCNLAYFAVLVESDIVASAAVSQD